MVNCNPETVSTDYDTSDRLYFEPLTLEDVLAICDEEKPMGVIVQFGGQTPLKLAVPLEQRGVKLLGTTADAIDRAEDRGRFDELLTKLSLKRPRSGIAQGVEEAFAIAERIGYPVLVRPSYVLGGRAMMIAYSRVELETYVERAVEAARDAGTHDDPRRRVPEGRDRGRRRLRRRRQARRDRRRDAAHRGGGDPQRRLVERPAAALAPRRDRPVDRGADADAGPRARRRRPDERAVRGERGRGLHPRGEPAREPHRAVRLEGDRATAREDRGAGDGRQDARRARRRPTSPRRATSR